MSFLDQALSHLNGVDLSAIAAKVGIPPEQVQAAIGALTQAHAEPGDTAEGAAAKTGLPLDQVQQVLEHIGGEGMMAKITGALGGLGGGQGGAQGGGLGGMLSGMFSKE